MPVAHSHPATPVRSRTGRRRRPGVAVAGMLLTAAVALSTAGCGTGQLAQTAQQAGPGSGAGARVGTIAIRDATLSGRAPVRGDTVHRPGDEVPVTVTIVNDAVGAAAATRGADRLVRVSGPWFERARITGDTRLPDGQSLTAGYRGPVSSVATSGDRRIGIVLSGLRIPVRAGTTYPVTFTFRRAGSVTAAVPVATPDVVVPRADGDPSTTR